LTTVFAGKEVVQGLRIRKEKGEKDTGIDNLSDE